MIKKLLSSIIIITMLLSTLTVFSTGSQEQVTVTLDGETILFPDAQPFLDTRDRTLVPIRFVSEAMGAEVGWEDSTTTVTIKKGRDTIVYTIGNLGAELNGVKYAFDTIGILKDERTFVPLRFISELLNCKVDWIEETYTVAISSPPPPVAFPEPKITVHFPEHEHTGKLLWITLDNLRDYSDCENYEFKIDFENPVEFNITEQDEGAILGWQTYHVNQWRSISVPGAPILEVSRKYYTTRENKEKLNLYDGMPLEFVLSVKRKCSGEIREYQYSDTFKYPYPAK